MDNNLEPSTPKRHRHSPLVYLGIIVSVIIIVLLFFFNTNEEILNLIQPNRVNNQSVMTKPSPSPLLNAPITSKFLSFQGCDIKKEGNPLVGGVRTVKDDIVGTFYGNINQVNLQVATKTSSASASLELISPKGEQAYSLTVKEENGLVYDAIAQRDLNLNDLKQGQTVDVTFNCFPKLKNQFKITKISVVGK